MSHPTHAPSNAREVFARFQREMLGHAPDDGLYAGDVVAEMPFAPPGMPRRIEGREHFLAFAAAGRASMRVRLEAFRDVVIHETADPEVIVVEYELAGRRVDDDRPVSAPFIGVLRVRDGQVAHWREYQNVLAMAEATGQPKSTSNVPVARLPICPLLALPVDVRWSGGDGIMAAMPKLAEDTEPPTIEEIYEGMDPVPGIRVELLDDRIVMSPPPATRHNVIVYRLLRTLIEVADKQGWLLLQTEAIHIPATRERPQPDLVVAPPDAPEYDDHELYGHGVALVAEVVSPRSRHEDLDYKSNMYALGEVSLYLVIDAVADVPTVTLFGDPTDHGYDTSVRIPLGKPLTLPEPFDITIDTASLGIG